jgi:NADPH:quinone reductase-like Zn-dependent oxidoreductase
MVLGMRALCYDHYGSPDKLRVREVAKPAPKDNDVLVRVRAASINDWDWQLLQGSFINRLFNGWDRPTKHRVLGCDVAGVVEAVGKDVTAFRPGAEVFGDLSASGFGGFAEYVCAPATCFALKAPAMSFEQAAALPQAGMLALQGLIEVGGVQAGQHVLLNGAGGGAGVFALQLAKLHGARVTAVDKGEKLSTLRALGADAVVDYEAEDITERPARYDLVLDVKTTRSPLDYVKVLKPRGTYVTMGGDLNQVFAMVLVGALLSQRFRMVVLKPNRDLALLKELFEAGKLKCVIDEVYALGEGAEAFRRFGSGRHRGKVIISME